MKNVNIIFIFFNNIVIFMIDLQKMLDEDETYRKILAASNPNERQMLENYMKEFMKAWQTQFFNPLHEKIEKDEEFREKAKKEIEEKNKKLG